MVFSHMYMRLQVNQLLFAFLLFINPFLQESRLRTRKSRGKIIFPPLQKISQSPCPVKSSKRNFLGVIREGFIDEQAFEQGFAVR